MNFVGNLYLNQRRSYTVYAIYPTVASEPPSVTRFMNSFSLIDSRR
jgi:hypothetical protein